MDKAALAPCNPRGRPIILHTIYSAHNGTKNLLFRKLALACILAVALACILNEKTEVGYFFGTGMKTFWFLAAHDMSRVLDPENTQAVPMFHTLMACNTVSSFAGHGKRTWAVLTVLPELTQTCTLRSIAPDHVNDDPMHTIQRFILLLYDKRSTVTDIDKASCKRFVVNKRKVQLISFTGAALEYMCLGSHALVRSLALPSPNDRDCHKTSGVYVPLRTTLPCITVKFSA